MTDGLFEANADEVNFHTIEQITQADAQRIQHTLRQRIVGLFRRRGILGPEQAQDLLIWVNRYMELVR